MSRNDDDTIVAHVVSAAEANLPLADALRASAEEATSPSLAKALQQIASELDQGGSLANAVKSVSTRLPDPIRSLLQASSGCANLGVTIREMNLHRQRQRAVWAAVRSAIAYPLIVLFFSAAVFTFIFVAIVPQFRTMFAEFGLKLTPPTLIIVWWSDIGIWIFLAFLGCLSVVGISFRFGLPRSMSHALFSTVPVFGSIWLWSGVAEWARWMSLFLRDTIPLPQAFRLAAQGTSDKSISLASLRIAERLDQGIDLPGSIWSEARIPATVIPFVIAGQKSNSLSDAYLTIAEFFEERVQQRAVLIRQVIPPVAFILVGVTTCGVVIGIAYPIISLIKSITG